MSGLSIGGMLSPLERSAATSDFGGGGDQVVAYRLRSDPSSCRHHASPNLRIRAAFPRFATFRANLHFIGEILLQS